MLFRSSADAEPSPQQVGRRRRLGNSPFSPPSGFGDAAAGSAAASAWWRTGSPLRSGEESPGRWMTRVTEATNPLRPVAGAHGRADESSWWGTDSPSRSGEESPGRGLTRVTMATSPQSPVPGARGRADESDWWRSGTRDWPSPRERFSGRTRDFPPGSDHQGRQTRFTGERNWGPRDSRSPSTGQAEEGGTWWSRSRSSRGQNSSPPGSFPCSGLEANDCSRGTAGGSFEPPGTISGAAMYTEVWQASTTTVEQQSDHHEILRVANFGSMPQRQEQEEGPKSGGPSYKVYWGGNIAQDDN